MSDFCEFIMVIFGALLILRYLYQVETLTDRVKVLEQSIIKKEGVSKNEV